MTDKLPRPRTDLLMTPREVAERFRVHPKSVTRWANKGRLTTVRTMGGHRRYIKSEVEALLKDEGK